MFRVVVFVDVAVGSVKPAIATLDLHVISVPKAKKTPKKKPK